jgi:hypothetical protein
MEERIYSILVLDENYIESFEVYKDALLAKKSFKKHLRDRGLGIIKQRKHLKEEFYREGEWQVQLIKTEVKVN